MNDSNSKMRLLEQFFILTTVLVTNIDGWFFVIGRKLYDSNGNEFIARGINTASADWDAKFPPAIVMPAVASTGANSVRILWLTDDKLRKKRLNDSSLVNVIQTAIDNRLIPILELWSFTGHNDYNSLRLAGQWWVSKMHLLKQFEDILLINVANEWSDWRKGRDDIPRNKIADWLWYVETCILPIRETGWRGTLIIDSTAYAQSPNAVLRYGHNMTSLDPLKNLMFSIHVYVDWREARKYDPDYSPYDKKMLAQIADMNIPLIIGEFGDRVPDSRRRIQLINARKVMRIADDNGLGYLGWSWKGNGIVNEVNLAPFLDISYEWAVANLTEWGKILVYDSRGLKNTSKIASVFDTKKSLNNTEPF